MSNRKYLWDNYKGVLIFLVVLGHYIYYYSIKLDNAFVDSIFNLIYIFHMPAFVFCSGYLSKSEKSRSKASLIQLFLYYIIFNTAMMLFLYFFRGISISVLSPYYSYWYLLSLIVWRFVIGELSTVKGIIPISLMITLLLGYNSEFSNVLSIRRTFAFFIFFLLGYLLDKEKFEKFLDSRNSKTFIMGLFMTVLTVVSILVFANTFDVTLSMVLMSTYVNEYDVFFRFFMIVVSIAMIVSLMMVLPNKEIPLLTSVGKYSLLVYLGHRFLTYLFNLMFPYKNYTWIYFVYAVIASILTCMILGNEKLNICVSQGVNNMTKQLVDEKSQYGHLIKLFFLILFILLLALNFEF